MAKATYYNEIGKGKVFDVLKDNKDGTVDLGTSAGVLVIGKCRVEKAVDGVAPAGTCVLEDQTVKAPAAAPAEAGPALPAAETPETEAPTRSRKRNQ